MIDLDAIGARLTAFGLLEWATELEPLIRHRLSPAAHGDLPRWQTALQTLASNRDDRVKTREALQSLAPWRKGPFELDDVTIDAEWRSDMKWARLEGVIQPLQRRKVLDVGCGNGYYAFRMRQAGAHSVVGLEPTLLYVMQFLAVNSFVGDDAILVLPIRLHELPGGHGTFDTVFSMGVLYHQRSPIDHLRQLRHGLRPGGELVLETIFIPGEESYACTPRDRYARMKNVWLLPTIAELTTWVERTGFRDVRVVDTAVTTAAEQRKTPWMTFESLADALDPLDASRTVEGWPAPRRVIVVARKPGA